MRPQQQQQQQAKTGPHAKEAPAHLHFGVPQLAQENALGELHRGIGGDEGHVAQCRHADLRSEQVNHTRIELLVHHERVHHHADEQQGGQEAVHPG